MSELFAQKPRRISKNSCAIDISTALSFAVFNEDQSRWQPTFYPIASLGIMGNHRLNARLDLDYGAGGTFYYLINKGTVGRYVLNFASPYLVAGLGYSFLQTSRQENYVKIQAIAQLGYDDAFQEVFDTYYR